MANENKDDMAMTVADPAAEIQLIEARSQANFQLTPMGQELKRFEAIQRMGVMFAKGTIIPDSYKNNVANCAIAVDMAMRMGVNPVMVMQNLYIVHGTPAWSSKFLISTINTCGRFMPLRYECNNKTGDEYGYRCYTYEKSDKDKKERLDGTWVTWAMVKAEGWNTKNGSKWKTMPEQMFRYRAAAFWQRMYAPEISMGFQTADELDDIADVPYVEIHTPKSALTATSVADFDESPVVETVDVETGEVTEMFPDFN